MFIASKNRYMLFENAIKLRLYVIWKIREDYLEQVKIELRLNRIELTKEKGELRESVFY